MKNCHCEGAPACQQAGSDRGNPVQYDMVRDCFASLAMTTMFMFKKLFLAIIILVVLLAWLGGVFSVTASPFSVTIQKPEKDFLKKATKKISDFVYHEATVRNPSGDLVPDQIDDKIKQEIKDKIN